MAWLAETACILLCKSIANIRNVSSPHPCGATGNDARKLHAYAFAHFRGAAFLLEVLLTLYSATR